MGAAPESALPVRFRCRSEVFPGFLATMNGVLISGVPKAHNKQLQRTVIRRRGRGACASLHYAHAPRITRQRAAAELRR